MQIIDIHRFRNVKRSFTTRNVDLAQARTIIGGDHAPAAGEIVLARVDVVGHHRTVEATDGRRSAIFPGDEVLLAYGNRYAPDQFEAYVPERLGPCNLAAGGGVAAQVVALHGKARPPTEITVTGVLGDSHGRALNLAEFALPAGTPRESAPVICVCGTSMNAGKTSSMAALVRGFTATGLRVGAVKATGTGAGNDLWIMRDSGAVAVLDFTDAGFATTFCAPLDAIEAGARNLIAALEARSADVIVMEIADGLLQVETRALLGRASFRKLVAGVVFTGGDSMGTIAGTRSLAGLGYNVLAASGLVTASPLGRREAESEIPQPVYGLDELSTADIADALLARARRFADRRGKDDAA